MLTIKSNYNNFNVLLAIFSLTSDDFYLSKDNKYGQAWVTVGEVTYAITAPVDISRDKAIAVSCELKTRSDKDTTFMGVFAYNPKTAKKKAW